MNLHNISSHMGKVSFAEENNIRFLNDKELDGVEFYTYESFVTEVRREAALLQHAPDFCLQVRNDVLRSSVKGAVVGFFAGAALGIYEKRDEHFSVKAPHALKKGAQGAVVGAAILGGREVVYKYFTIKSSDVYLKWRSAAISAEIFEKFLSLLHVEALDEFRCPFTQEIIRQPFADKNGRVYEKSGIENWLKKCKQECDKAIQQARKSNNSGDDVLARKIEKIVEEYNLRTCVNRSGLHITMDSLEYDLDYHPRVFKKIKEVYNDSIEEEQRLGFEMYKTNVREERDQICTGLMGQLMSKFQLDEIDEKEYLHQTKFVKKRANSLTLKKL